MRAPRRHMDLALAALPILLALLAGCQPNLERSERAIERALTPKTFSVVDPRAVDGDTLDAGERGRIRLIGIDCPEVGDPGADAATRFTAAMCEDTTVHLAISPLWPQDVYGRHRAIAYVPGSGGLLCLNAELIRRGLARPSSMGPEAFDVRAWAKLAGPGATPSRLDDAGLPDPSRVLVYVTATGTKYHRPDCRHARKGAPTTLAAALARGLGPCGSCRPPVVDP